MLPGIQWTGLFFLEEAGSSPSLGSPSDCGGREAVWGEESPASFCSHCFCITPSGGAEVFPRQGSPYLSSRVSVTEQSCPAPWRKEASGFLSRMQGVQDFNCVVPRSGNSKPSQTGQIQDLRSFVKCS